jgi:hypothetical protein
LTLSAIIYSLKISIETDLQAAKIEKAYIKGKKNQKDD